PEQILSGFTTAGGALAQPILLGTGEYFLEYPEDIQLYGLSFSTTLPTGTAWAGEISYRPNLPLQINGTDMTAKLATVPAGAYAAAGGGAAGVAAAMAEGDQYLKGYRRKEVTQVQTTLTHFVDQVLGASRLTLVGELGLTSIGGLESRDEIAYGRDSIYGSPHGSNASNLAALQDYGTHGFYTNTSWGYRARAILDY